MGKKATFVLNEQLMADVKKVVEAGHSRSMSNFVETAVKDELAKIKAEQVKKAIVEASRDPLFLADIKEVEKDFAAVDFEEGEK